MNGWKGILAGSLALITLHTLVAYNGPSQRLNDLVGRHGILTGFVDRFLDPTMPAIGGSAGFSVAAAAGTAQVIKATTDVLATAGYPLPSTPRTTP